MTIAEWWFLLLGTFYTENVYGFVPLVLLLLMDKKKNMIIIVNTIVNAKTSNKCDLFLFLELWRWAKPNRPTLQLKCVDIKQTAF